MPSAIDIFVSYKFIKQLSTPWDEWEAYELGLIDDKGNRLKKATSPEEKKAFPLWKVFVRNIKKLLDKLPFGKSKLGSFAGALYLLKEELKIEDASILEQLFIEHLNDQKILIETDNSEKINTLVKGRYLHRPSGDVIILKNNVISTESILEEPIFVVTDYITDKKYVLIAEELEEF